jgi:RsmE family RNA methyltransferase
MNIILLNAAELDADGTVMLPASDRRAMHVRTVLRSAVGDRLRIGLLDGPLGTGLVTALGAEGPVRLQIEQWEGTPRHSKVDLVLALPRPKVMKRLWAPLASLGIRRLVLVNAARVERHYFDTHWLEPAHYRPLLQAGLEQARDTRMPEVSLQRRLKPFIEDDLDAFCEGAVRLLCDPGGRTRLADKRCGPSQRVVLAIGPEGGWTDFERNLFGDRGFDVVSMGSRPLRTDTACIAALAIAHEAVES